MPTGVAHKWHLKYAKKTIREDSEGGGPGRDKSPSSKLPDDLLVALTELTISETVRRHSPVFLQRNLRASFLAVCREDGLSVEPNPPPADRFDATIYLDPDVEVDGEESQSYSLPTRELLERHLNDPVHDHISANWTPPTRRNKVRWRLFITVPESFDTDTEYLSDSSSEVPTILRTQSPEDRKSERLAATASHTPVPTPPAAAAVKVEPDVQPVQTQAVPAIKLEHHEDQYESSGLPPPRTLDKFFYPTVKPPYLPATAEDGTVIHYSCRPGGPKLYNLLDTLSLEEYGLQEWSIIDDEDEILEVEDQLDEDKVISALWNRWVALYP
ncbi:hypothetical protein K488DRAFT_81357 [Vararia minispora EC-137]|uniref:Uncharacterized protein n=1 Tax=Vararia minispora EC-137 TaxID=1314806 RepID=A0ACB8R0I4_9AGAM|nr:hypothetical protein K488DRAFT_81357 [Vararia minispora EC-137]